MALDSIHRFYDSASRTAPAGHPSSTFLSRINQVLKNTQPAVRTEVMSAPKSKNSDTTAAMPGSNGNRPNAIDSSPYVPDDPQKNRWGKLSERNGRKMTATVESIGYHTYRITIIVTNSAGALPLNGDVMFHLHPTFRNQNPIVAVRNGRAVLSLVAVGSFTVGATMDEGKTNLEYDLVDEPGADEYFKTH